MSGKLTVDTREVDRIAKQLNVNTEAIVRRIAFEVEGQAKQNSPLETGALRNSIYSSTDRYNGYSEAAAAAKSANPEVETSPHPVPTSPGVAHVGPCVDYGIHQEYGTSRMAAQPFLGPAAEKVGQKYNSGAAWQELVK